MSALPTYSAGTVSINNGDTVIVGVGTMWTEAGAMAGDSIQIDTAQPVEIRDFTDGTHLPIWAPWSGGNKSGAAYQIIKKSPLRYNASRTMVAVDQIVATMSTDGYYFNVPATETVPNPSYGNEGQYAMQATTGKLWVKSGGVWVYLGVNRGVMPRGNYSAITTYNQNDLIYYAPTGSSYLAVATSVGQALSDSAYFMMVAAKGDTGPVNLKPIVPWATGIAYVIGPPASYVTQGGSSYQCLTAHTSGTFATDLAAGRWGLVTAQGAGDVVAALNGAEYPDKPAFRANIGVLGASEVLSMVTQSLTLPQSLTVQSNLNLTSVHRRANSPWLPNWGEGLLAALTQTGDASLLVLSDSSGVGFGAQPSHTNATAFNWFTLLRQMLLDYGLPVYPQSRMGCNGWNYSGAGSLPLADSRILQMGGYQPSTFSSLGGPMFQANAAGAPLRFQPVGSTNYFRVWYALDPSFGSFKIDVSGGTPVTISAAGTQNVSYADVGGSPGTSVLNITPLSGRTEIIGFWGFNSSNGPSITMWNGSFNGAQAGDFVSTTYPWSPLNMIGTLAPVLTIIMLTSNAGGSAPVTTAANYQTLINKAKLSGDVVMVGGFPADASAISLTAQATIQSVAAAVAAKNKIPFISIPDYFGSWLNMNAAGYAFDTVHPSGSGHAAAAAILAPLLR